MACPARKETLRISSLLTLLILIVEYSFGTTLENTFGLMGHILFGTGMKNKNYTYDFIPLLTSLNHQNYFDIGILYDSRYTETIEKTRDLLANEVSGERITGMTLLQCPGSTTIGKLLQDQSNHETILVTFCSFTEVLDIFKKIKTERLKSHFVKWVLIFNLKEFEEESMVTLQDLIFEGTQVTLVTRENTGVYHVLEASVSFKGKIRFYIRGQWENPRENKRQQLVMSKGKDRYLDMNGRQLTIAAIYPKLNPDGTYRPQGIVEYGILQSLTKMMNFTYHIVPPPDGAWGNPQPDGTITGMIGMVARREAHFALNKIDITAKRATVIEYTTPWASSSLVLISRTSKEANRALAALSPFNQQVWICIIIATLAIGPITKFHSKISQDIGKEKITLDLQDYAFCMFRNLVVQGNPIIASNWPQRMIFFSWYLFCFLIYAAYAGLLTAVLAVPSFEKPVDSLEDLPDAVANGFTIGTTGDTSVEYVFKEAKSGIYKQTWDLFNHKDRSKSFVSSAPDGLNRVVTNKYIYILPHVIAELYVRYVGSRKFHFGRELFYPTYIALPLPPGAPYRQPINVILHRLNEGGLLQKWGRERIDNVPDENTEEHEGEAKEKIITLVHLQAAFFILVLGYLTATNMLTIEILYFFVSRRDTVIQKER